MCVYVLNIFHIFSFVCFVIHSVNRFESNFLIGGVARLVRNLETFSLWAHIWAHMGSYGPLWAHMGPYGSLWVLLDRSWKIT